MSPTQATQSSLQDWQKRERRATELAEDNPPAAEVLHFYAAVLHFQAEIFAHAITRYAIDPARPLRSQMDLEYAAGWIPNFCKMVEKHAPDQLAAVARELRMKSVGEIGEVLTAVASTPLYDPSSLVQFFGRAVLQPYAEALARQLPQSIGYSGSACPFCDGAPQVAVLRPEGDGGKRFLLCSFCLREWEFRRVICAWCGEEDHHKLPRFGTDEVKHMMVFACDTCKHYIKAVDMTLTGLAVPLVDELSAAPLDLWAIEQGYKKIVPNLLGI
jgi:FdhE protein